MSSTFFSLYLQELTSDNVSKNRGAVITGGVGFGKTAIIELLIEYSCYGKGQGGLVERGEDLGD